MLYTMANLVDKDLMSIGLHCSEPSCGQVDFLPFTCDCCQRTFCLEHRTYSAHNCPKAGSKEQDVIICPICARAVKLVKGEDPNVTFERHSARECDPTNYDKVYRKPRCPVQGCKEKLTSINTYRCKHCHASVCLKHRLPDDHACMERRQERGRSASAPPVDSSTKDRSCSLGSLWQSVSSGKASTGSGPSNGPAAPARAAAAVVDLTNTVKGTVHRRIQGRAGGVATPMESCHHCDAKFSLVEDLVRHYESVHQQRPPLGDYACPHCGWRCRDPVQLLNHRQTCTATKTPTCVLC